MFVCMYAIYVIAIKEFDKSETNFCTEVFGTNFVQKLKEKLKNLKFQFQCEKLMRILAR